MAADITERLRTWRVLYEGRLYQNGEVVARVSADDEKACRQKMKRMALRFAANGPVVMKCSKTRV